MERNVIVGGNVLDHIVGEILQIVIHAILVARLVENMLINPQNVVLTHSMTLTLKCVIAATVILPDVNLA
jgi:hypothetical protein